MVSVEFHFDFGSPNAYLAHCVIPDIERRTGASFTYVPILLGGVFKATNNRSPVESYAGVRNKLEYERLEMARFVKRHRLAFEFNPHFPINTLALMRGAVAAQKLGVFAPYADAMFRSMWVEGRKMDDPAIVQTAISHAGLDAAKLLALTQDPEVKERLIANTNRSVERGTFGAPTFYVGEEIYFGKDRLADVEAAIRAAG